MVTRRAQRRSLERYDPAGARSITVSEPVDWQVGDAVVVTSTGFDRVRSRSGSSSRLKAAS